jgi:uncharacterized protein (TIGR03067 family)
MRLLMTLALLALPAWVRAADDDAKTAAKKLEGTYEVVAIIIGGKPDPKKDDVKAVEIKDGQIIVKGKDTDTAPFALDPSKKPGHIDITPKGEKPVPGIYEVKETDTGTELTIAFNEDPKGERPKDFKGEGNVVVLKLLRKKAK